MSDFPTKPIQPVSREPAAGDNTVGLIGFVLSLCGTLCLLSFPIGLLVSLVGLRGQPKGFAIAGAIVGGIGTMVMVVVFLVYATAFAACIGIGVATAPVFRTAASLEEGRQRIERHISEHGELPSDFDAKNTLSGLSDGWQNPIRFERDESHEDGFIIRSPGPDGVFDTSDDVTSDDMQLEEFPEMEIEYEPEGLEAVPAEGAAETTPIDAASENAISEDAP